MSTRSTVSLLTKENTVKSIYIHFDGYLSHNGQILLSEYQNYEDVLKLVSFGHRSTLPKLSELGPDGDGGDDNSCKTYRNIIQWCSKMMSTDRQEYNYIFIIDKWYLFTPAKLTPLKDMIDAVVKEDGTERAQFSKTELSRLGKGMLKGFMIPGGIISTSRYGLPCIRLEDGTTIDMRYVLYDCKFVDSVGFASLMISALKKEEERNARERQCEFGQEDGSVLALAEKYRKIILGYDRAAYIPGLTADEYFDYFINLIVADQLTLNADNKGWLEDVLEEEFQNINFDHKGYVAKRIAKLVPSMPVSDKKRLTATFCRPIQSRSRGLSKLEKRHAYLLDQYLSNLEKYGHGYVDEMKLLQRNAIYRKLCQLDEELPLKCKDRLFEQVSSIEKYSKASEESH